MRSPNRRSSPLRAGAALLSILLLVLPAGPASAGNRGSVRGVNRNAGGTSWSGARTSGSTSRTATSDGSKRTTTAQTRSGQSATGTRDVSRSGDEVTVDRNVSTSTGASKSSQKTYEVDDGRVQSVERDVNATSRTGQSASWEGKAERSGAGWEFEGEGKNRYGEEVKAEGYGARGPYGAGVVADVEGGRYGDRTVVAGRAYGAPVHAAALPYGARPYTWHGHAYYGHAGVYYRPYTYHGVAYYHYIPPPWGCYYTTVPVGAIALTVAGMALLYSDGTYYKTTYVQGATQYEVVPPPAGASLPPGTVLPADRAAITISGVTYYLYGNTFYKRVVASGKESFVVITKPAGVVTVKALPADFEPMQAGSLMYFRAKDRFYLNYLDPGGEELFVVVDPPAGAEPAIAAAPAGQKPAAAAAPPAAKPKAATLTAPPSTPLTVRVSAEVSSATAQAGQRFQGNLANDLVADGRVLATKGTRAYGRVVEAKAGTGAGGAPVLAIELTDIEVGGRVMPLKTEAVRYTAEAKKAGKKVLGGAALGAGIGGMIDGGEGAAWGAAAGAVAGAAAAKSSPGNQVAVAAGTAVEFRLSQPLSLDVVG